jgi:uncharacterized protein YndB with AHSA1/START domain
METVAVERSIWIAVPCERVWRAITDPAQLEQWYAAGCPWDIPALAVGAKVRFHNSASEVLQATIAARVPPRRFALRWEPEPAYPQAVPVTTFLLDEEEGGTRVTVAETGDEALPENVRQARVDQTAQGYAWMMEALGRMMESGTR